MTTVALCLSPIQHFHATDGDLLNGGLLYTYEAGTTTPQATYTDSTGATPQTNPIVLNSRGEPANGVSSVGIWLVVGEAYKFALTDSVGNPLWTLDQILPGGSNIPLSSLAPIAADTIVGNPTGSPASPIAMSEAQTTALLVPVVGDSGSGGTKGLVPAPPAGSTAAHQFLGAGGNFTGVGITSVPLTAKAGAYGLALTDAGTEIAESVTSTVTIPANASVAFPIGTVIVVSWAASATGTLAITSDTLLWPAGGAATGSRTIAGAGFAVIRKYAATTWWVVASANMT